MKFLSIRLVSERRLTNRLFAVLFIGLALLGHTSSQDESSGDGIDEDDTYDDVDVDDENSGGGLLTLCQQRSRDNVAGYQPKCLPDGQFASRQCSRGVCFCVDEQGKRIINTEGTDDCDSYASQDITFEEPGEVKRAENENIFIDHPVLLAGVVGGVVICLLCAVLIVMFIVYRMKKKDEGSYILGRAERKSSRSVIYTKAVPRDQEFYA